MQIPLVALAAALWWAATVPGCGHDPLPAVLTPAPQTCGNPCATRTCPSAYTCQVDSHCAVHCQPESLGNKLF